MGSGGGGSTTVTNMPGPQQEEAFRFRLDQAQAGLGNLPQGAGYFTNPANSPYQLSQAQQQALQNVQQAAGATPPDPTSNWAMQSYAPGAQQLWNTASGGVAAAPNPSIGQWNQGAQGLFNQWQGGAQYLGDYLMQNPIMNDEWRAAAQFGASMANAPISVGSIDRSAGNVDFEATGATYDPVSVGTQAPVEVEDIDPTAAIQAAQHQLSVIASPEIRAALQAGGLGRSGAEGEALAREGVRLELPIQQQILQAKAQANQLEAQIRARQEEVQLLEEQKAKLQAQQLTATSREQAQAINGQLAGIEAQIQGRLAEAEFMGGVQAAIAQRTSALQYAASTLGQMAGMNTAQQQILAGTGTALLGQQAQLGTGLLGQLAGQGMASQQLGTQANLAGYQGQLATGQGILNNLTQMGLQIPNLQAQQYQLGLLGAQTGLQAASIPQQLQQQQYQNLQNYILSLLGASPLPSQVQGGTTNQSQTPGTLNTIGTLALLGSLFGGQG